MKARDLLRLLDLPVSETLDRVPGAAAALRRAGMASCLGCAMAPFETLREAALELGVDEQVVLRELGRARGGPR